jgi:hypothetical protein
MVKRYLVVSCVLASACASPILYRQQGTENLVPSSTAQVFREFCIGGNRGLVHFDSLDGLTVRDNPSFKGGWPMKLVLTPGVHTIGLDFKAPGFQGDTSITHNFEGGKVYLVKYKRISYETYRTWIELLPLNGEIDAEKVFCTQAEPFTEPVLSK